MTGGNGFGATFAMIDTDQDGFITVSEFTRMINLLGEWKVNEEIAASMFAQADGDRDGRITLAELTDYLAKPSA
ncbi:MAG TPA: EF-hand domain-containing protein [Kineosporiaceae bacterium]|nr:EF-hand domain-containing protein [Kineosporiaceae bacterium]